jgi:hypothetical protein
MFAALALVLRLSKNAALPWLARKREGKQNAICTCGVDGDPSLCVRDNFVVE